MKLLIYTSIFHVLGLMCIGACSTQNASVAEPNSEAEINSIAISIDSEAPYYQVSVNRPYLSFSKNELKDVSSLLDLDPNYKSSWISSYISVAISSEIDGKTVTVSGKNQQLNPEQKNLIHASDSDAPITVEVIYMPENNLSDNTPKEIKFLVMKTPEVNAQFPKGQDALMSYLNTNAIDLIPEGTYTGYDLTALTFTVTKKGTVDNLTLVDPSFENETITNLLKKAITDMPQWIPARYADGTLTSQDFALVVGNVESCTMNLVNID